MEHYTLQPDEVLLYNGAAIWNNERKDQKEAEIILTNLYFVFVLKTKKFLQKLSIDLESFPLSDVKIYNEQPQIKNKGTSVEIFFKHGERLLEFESKKEARKFTATAMEVLTGYNVVLRGLKKSKQAVESVDEVLGINSVGVAQAVVSQGVGGLLLNGTDKKNNSKKGAFLNFASNIFQKKETPQQTVSTTITAEQFNAIKSLKELLDNGIITQEEFDKKKNQILGL